MSHGRGNGRVPDPDAAGEPDLGLPALEELDHGLDDDDGGDDVDDEELIPQDFPALLEEGAGHPADVEIVRVGAAVEYRVAGQPIVVAAGRILEVRLAADIADAALRTPDVTPSGRGADWVRFAPPTIDGHAADRALAWFAVARRRAGRGR
jgi:hypothetical protein